MPANPPAAARGGYDVARPGGVCHVTGRDIPPGTKFAAGLREGEAGLQRIDVLPEAWESIEKADLLAFWQTTMPEPRGRRQVFVDDGVLCDLFARLDGADEEQKQHFRFVLGLILIRKRLLAFEGEATDDDGRSVWRLRWRGKDKPGGDPSMLDPKLTEPQVEAVSLAMGEILNAEL